MVQDIKQGGGMDKLVMELIEKEGQVCELKQLDGAITDDCEKLMYLALAEGQKQPVQIQIKSEDGMVKRTIFAPDNLHEEELTKRNQLLNLLGEFLNEVIGLPEDIGERYYGDPDDLYGFLLQMLELSGWGLLPQHEELKMERGDEISKRDNIVLLTADLLQYNNLASPQILADFYNYPEKVSADHLIRKIKGAVETKNTPDDDFMVYVMDQPSIMEDQVQSGLLPVFEEHDGSLRIIAWISQEVIPHNLVPVFDFEQKLIGWLDQNSGMDQSAI